MGGSSVLTVSEVNKYLGQLFISDPVLQDIWISGEISNFKHHSSGHMYFTLKDQQSALSCVFFRRQNAGCLFAVNDGLKVLARGHLSVYERAGVYQLYVAELKPEGLGSLYLAYEQLKKKLAAQGLFEAKHKKLLPRIPRKIAVVTSPTGAVIRDILKTLERRFPRLEVLIVPAAVQGAKAPQEIVAALAYLNSRRDIEVIILARGGGSLEELWAFNTEEVARAIFAARAPVVTAVGHETDYSIADLVADVRASTPTAAAEIIVPEQGELLQQISGWEERLAARMQQRLHREKEALAYLTRARALRMPFEHINKLHLPLDQLVKSLDRQIEQNLIHKARNLKGLVERLEALNPLKIMRRGFAFCQDEQGRLLNSVQGLKIGQGIKLFLQDGEVFSRIEQISGGE